MSLQARTRLSVQTELDLNATSDRWQEREREKRNVVFVLLKVSLIRDVLQWFSLLALPKECECVCVLYYCLPHYFHAGYITECVCFTHYLHHYTHTD